MSIADIQSEFDDSIPNLADQKLQLEILRLKSEAEDLKATRALATEKISLEIAHLKSTQALHGKKLELEVGELRRSQWLRPGTMIPIIATLATLAWAQFLNVFEVQSKLARIEAKEISINLGEVKASRELLRNDVVALEGAKIKLQAERAEMDRQNAKLALQMNKLQLDSSLLREESKKVVLALHLKQEELKYVREVLAQPKIDYQVPNLSVEKKAGIYLRNLGPGRAKIAEFKAFVDGDFVPADEGENPLGSLLLKLGMHRHWIRWHEYSSASVFDPGKSYPFIVIEPEMYSREQGVQLVAASDRLGLHICFCSDLGRCEWFLKQPAPPAMGRCSNVK